MAKCKVEWSIEARLDLIDILDFYIQRNGNSKYSRKLNSKIQKSTKLISRNPLIGIKTDVDSVRAIVTGDYHILYEIIGSLLLIIMVWDCRRDPVDKMIPNRTST